MALLFFAALLAVGTRAGTENPVLKAMIRLGAAGVPSKAAPSTSPGKFSHADKLLYVDRVVEGLVDAAELRAGLKAAAAELIKNYETQAQAAGTPNDACAALAFTTCLLHTVLAGKETPDPAFKRAVSSLQAALDAPEVRNASDRQKQEAYETLLVQAALTLFVAQSAKTDDERKKVAELATAQLLGLTGAKPDQLTITETEFSIKGVAAPAAAAGLAPGFSFQAPGGWVQEGAWHVVRQVENRGGGREVTTASVRFLPAVPARGAFGDALRLAWKSAVPDELSGKASGMVFRRYVGDQLAAHFIFGEGLEKGRQAPTLFTLYLIDCQTMWQPVLIANTYQEPDTRFPTGIEMIARLSYPRSVEMAEPMLKSFRCPAAKGRPLIDPAAVAGDYHFGSAAALQWENIYTGASSMTHVAYGGTLFLKPGKTFTYTFVSATGQNGVSKIRNARGQGSWSLSGDLLTLSFSQYDQGEGKQTRKDSYRVAGLMQYADGTKVLVLQSRLDLPINPTTVSDAGEYYSTRKSG